MLYYFVWSAFQFTMRYDKLYIISIRVYKTHYLLFYTRISLRIQGVSVVLHERDLVFYDEFEFILLNIFTLLQRGIRYTSISILE